MGSRLREAGELSNRDRTGAKVMDESGFGAIETDETEATEDAFGTKVTGEKLLVPKPVLQREEHGVLFQQRWDERLESLVGRCLERNEHEVARTDLLRGARSLNALKMEVTLLALHSEATFPNVVEIAPHQEMDVAPSIGEHGAIVATNGSAADDGDAIVR